MTSVRRLTTGELPPNDNDRYTLHVLHAPEMQSYNTVRKGLSWPSVCGHLSHAIPQAETVLVYRERDDVVVLKYDMDGYDL